ncbi:uncharacterized protein BO87DRAFT_456842 [Aspergillus neoniger CBS 115656]|uniref:Actin cortical patch SUR7/pH-response regulator PalI n=1 Tax=Aspergillus neoniger (strain CBS 115656) TaxID=1448310 RepID=A0A318YRQ2_ASPNB|nr:hypothetical protein BO87DRAFT_456842 [Aspergillus neoniger CBS 115656]PYH37149.1 hypothetical protein BO87DRAFT_456842 [Aspergillus neoniger CBS 115656]
MGCLQIFLPGIGSCIAFLLGILSLFAGSQRQFLPQADLLTLHTGGAGGQGAPDYFSIYTMSYCTGYQETYISDETTNATSTKNEIVDCSDRTVLFTFKPGEAIIKAMGTSSGSLSPDSWPSWITDDFEALAPTNTAMVLLMILGTTASAISIGIRIWTVVCARASEKSRPPMYPGRPASSFDLDIPPSSIELLAYLASLLTFAIASIIASVITTEFVKLINKSGSGYGVSTTTGTSFMGMVWTAAVLQALTTANSLVAILRYRAQHCRCDWDESASSESVEQKPQVGGE